MKPYIFLNSKAVGKFLIAMMALVHASDSYGTQRVFGPPEAESNLNGQGSFIIFGSAEERFQQVYNAEIFSSVVPSGGGYISAICFRADPFIGHHFETTISSLQLNLSTTSKAADGLSTLFSENVGSDDMVIIGPQRVSLLGGPPGLHECFAFIDHPFFYDPSQGNLLLDFRVFNNPDEEHGLISPMNAFNVAGDSVSSVFGHGPGGSVTGQTSTLGLATAFSFTPVPEPSTFALLSLGGLLAAAFGWTRSQKE